MTDEVSRIKDSLTLITMVGGIFIGWYCIAAHRTEPHRISSHPISSHLITSHRLALPRLAKEMLHQLMDNTPLCGNITRGKLRMRFIHGVISQDSPGTASYTRDTNFGVNDRSDEILRRNSRSTGLCWCALILSPSSWSL